MPLRTLILDRLAADEFRKAEHRYRRLTPATGQRFRQAVNDAIQRIATVAEQGSPYRHRYRWMQVKRFPYLIYYEIRDPHPVYVYAVAHTSRRLGYWRQRRPP